MHPVLRRSLEATTFLTTIGIVTPPSAQAITCSVSMTNVAFGSADLTTGAAVNTTGTMSLTCSSGGKGSTMRACLNIDGGSASDGTSRIMSGPSSSQLRYELYSDSARTTVWGKWGGYGGAGVQVDIPMSGGNASASYTVYGRIWSNQQSAPSGSYSATFSASPSVKYEAGLNASCPNLNTGPATTSFQVTATNTPTCTVSASTLNFGSTGVLFSSLDATSTISATCTNGTAYNLGLNQGTASGATVTTRKMTSGGATVSYSLYRDSSRTQNWGNTVGTDTASATGSGSAQSFTVYGRVPTQSTPAPATYSDTITVTLTY